MWAYPPSLPPYLPPFLSLSHLATTTPVLAIGVDNVFLLTWAFDDARLPIPAGTQADDSSSSQDRESEAVDGSSDRNPCAEGEGQGGGRLTNDLTEGATSEGMEEGVTVEGVKRSARAVARVGPSIVCAAAAECGAFLLGATTGMPAVISFSRFAAVAVAVDVGIQLTLFPAVLALTYSMRREQLARHPQQVPHTCTKP